MDRAPVFELTTNDWNHLSSDAFRQHMHDEGLTVKELARALGCNDRTAENYVSGRNSPRDVHFLRSIAVVPTFAAAVREVCGMVGDLDPRAMHQAMKVMQEASRFLDAMGANTSAFNSSDEADAGEDDRDRLTGDLFEPAGRA
jgi:transcriptional regulator with XRE-family HTH domain